MKIAFITVLHRQTLAPCTDHRGTGQVNRAIDATRGTESVVENFFAANNPLRTLPFEVNCQPTTSSSIGQPAAFIPSISCEPPPMPSCSVQRVLSERCL